jgi:arabinosaccharide transport system substrate-binding protein
MQFPFGKAPLWILITTIAAALAMLLGRWSGQTATPDLVMATFSRTHVEFYEKSIPAFERKHGVKVQLQLVDMRALTSRLQAAMIAGTGVPDLVEVEKAAMGYFTKGPLDDIGFVDLTDRLRADGLFEKMVASRFSLWTSRGRTFAIPHDVHPVMLAYRRDIVEELGIDVSTLRTWDDFAAMGRRITADVDGDGVVDRYALDLPTAATEVLELLILQRGGAIFDAAGEVAFDSPVVADTICWYVAQTTGSTRISFPAGWGQTLSKIMLDGLVVFYFAPDWRTKQFEIDGPGIGGKMALMPLPSWDEGGRRVSTWGGTGLAITKASKRPDLAWEFAKHIYLDQTQLGDRFLATNIISPLEAAWNSPVYDSPNAFYSDQPLGRLYADLAPSTPASYAAPYLLLGTSKLGEVLIDAGIYYAKNQEIGLREFVSVELKRKADEVRRVSRRNAFLFPDP